MSGEGSLFERIRLAVVRDDLRSSQDPDEVAHSVCRNLERVLNNWRGSVPIEPALGMPDDAFVGSDQKRIGRQVAVLLKENIQRFEPRFKEVHVQFRGVEDIPVARGSTASSTWEFWAEGRLVTADGRPRAGFRIRRRADRYTVNF